MRQIKIKEIMAYVLVAVFAVGLAFSISLKFLKFASSQEQEPEVEAVAPESPAPVATESEPSAPAEELISRPQFPVDSSTAGTARTIEVFLEPFIYDEKDRRDPFKPYVDGGDSGVALTPLQRYGLGTINLIGIMWDVKSPRAMFVDPANEVHVLGRDESIGNKNGYIAAIREGEVVVVEAERTESGLDYSTKILKLAR